MFIGLLVGLIIRALIFVIILGSVFAMIRDVSRPNWTRAVWVRLLIVLAEGMCRPVKRVMIGVGIPTRPLDFSPAITIVLLEILGRVLGWIF
jgi:uncharacterized protein YggT (Ycf19 family)